MEDYESKLTEMGITIPIVQKPVAAYLPGVIEGGYIYTSGQLPIADGVLAKGKLGENISTEEGYRAAALCAVNCLAVIKSLAGSLEKVEKIIKLTGFVNCTADYTDQPKVINGASELMREVFGVSGMHARSAVGVSSLPLGACCEVEMIVKLKQ